ncbi:hydroxyacid dehydrogenase [candidate division KSB1 bacterium]|nr:hydroxyacid dehydrogenase [candidate division KSB1 bacterium]
MHLRKKKKNDTRRCVNLFNPTAEVFRATFPEEFITELKGLVDYWRPEGEIERLIQTDFFFRELLLEAEILITGWGTPKLPIELLSQGQLKFICNVTGSIRHCISKDFLEKGFVVTNWGSAISKNLAEATLMLMLACLRRLNFVRKNLEAGYWDQNTHKPQSLCRQRVGLLGFGQIAQELVRFLLPFNTTIQAYDPYVKDDTFQLLGVQRVKNLKSLFSDNTIISLHASMIPELDGVVNKELLSLMPDNGVLINTARGGLVNETDLLEEFKKGRLWCGLDVFASEPLPPDSPFRFLPRCIITPHTGGPTPDCYQDMGAYAVQNIRRYVKGEPLEGVILPKQYDRIT